MGINTVSTRGRDLIKSFEGCRLEAYRDQANVATIGVGHTQGVLMGQKIDQATADQYFERDIDDFAMRVKACLTREPTQEQFDALCSLAFNIGVAGFKGSTVCAKFNAGDDIAAANAFGLWNKMRVNGALIESPGLTHRRAAEKALYLEGVPKESAVALAEVVPEAKPLSESGTRRGAQVGVWAGGLTAVTALVQQAQDFLMNIPWAGSVFQWMVAYNPKVVGGLAVAIVGAALYVGYRRWQDREHGLV